MSDDGGVIPVYIRRSTTPQDRSLLLHVDDSWGRAPLCAAVREKLCIPEGTVVRCVGWRRGCPHAALGLQPRACRPRRCCCFLPFCTTELIS